MTPEDFEISLKLARFMGWTEVQTPAEHDAARRERRTCFAIVGAQDEILVYPHDGIAPSVWKPLTSADHAAAVMAEVARRGGRVETACQYGKPPFTIAHVYLRPAVDRFTGMDYGNGMSEDENPAIAWCRAVCLGVLTAIEAAECSAEIAR